MRKSLLFLPFILLAAASCCHEGEISRSELKEKIAGAWLGQMVGNIYGLEYENKFVDEPGEGPFVFNKAMRKMAAVDGAFSDDDTDVEYLYLMMMEKNGVDPTYAQAKEEWMYHIRDRVWLANRAALGLMHYGFNPPFTGKKEYNPHWFQIDPQLINEIWAYTAPGMPAYAAGISDWAARITSDDWAVSPTVVYGSMYSEAFFESDIPTLVRHAKARLPKGDRFRRIIDECLDLWEKNPDDWKVSRKVIADELYFNEPDITRSIWNADLNGALGILSLLYGGGDIEKTLNIGCALGFDCDNQTATMCGLLGVINGVGSVPLDRAMPFEHWTKPFNDRYINVTRYDMPDASIEDIIERTVVLAEKNILARGGKVREENGEKIYTVNRKARFIVPDEPAASFTLPEKHGRNLAVEAAEILALTRETDTATLDSCWLTIPATYRANTVDVINDGICGGPGAAFYSLGSKSNAPKRDYFGYRWDSPVTTDMISFHYGPLEEFGGWYSNLQAEYLDADGNWQVLDAAITPALPYCDEVFFQPHNGEFILQFAPVTTTAVRVIGDDKVQDHWHKYTKNVSSFISITELQVYEAKAPRQTVMSTGTLLDKIMGGWAGQTIGVVYGAPTEFKHQGTLIPDNQPISWGEGYVKHWWDRKPGLFDDVYNDLTFAEAFEQLGLDCTSEELAMRFAYAPYHLAHANQAGRYNVRQGIMPPQSGNWMNNPHADDLDFQIEADFIGLMAPGMLQQALDIASKVGHIMNSGDGFYGGAYVSGLYSAAFISSDPAEIVDMALAGIPAESTFYQCIDDVRKLHRKYPRDWKQTWFEILKKWGSDTGCPKGVFLSFDIDAKINSAYVTIGLLYGGGDFGRSMEIATRCGQDSDCNPATVGGVLGVMLGKSGIPAFWREPVEEIWDLDFEGTDVSLAKGSAYSYNQALQLIAKNGGTVSAESAAIPVMPAKVLPLEQNFVNTFPVFRDQKDAWMEKEYEFDFSGNGFCIWGNLVCLRGISKGYADRVSKKHVGSEVFALAEEADGYVAEIEVWIDGELDQLSLLPMKGTSRKLEPAWKYLLPEGRHHVKMIWRNPDPSQYLLRINAIQYYSENPAPDVYYHN